MNDAYRELIDLRASVQKNGLAMTEDEQLLATLLAYAMPHGAADLAKELMARHGSLTGILQTDAALLAGEGVPPNAAALLSFLLPAYGRILRSDIAPGKTFGTVDAIGDYFTKCLCGCTVECIELMMLRDDYTMIGCRRVAEGSVNSAAINTRALVELALFSGARFVAIAHNHPGGTTEPSRADTDMTVGIRSALSAVGITLLEHIIVCGREYAPVTLRYDSVLRSDDRTPLRQDRAATTYFLSEEIPPYSLN